MPIFPSFQYFNFAVPAYHFRAGLLYLLTHHKALNLLKSLTKIVTQRCQNSLYSLFFRCKFNYLQQYCYRGIYIAGIIDAEISMWLKGGLLAFGEAKAKASVSD